jgi:CHAD domain-containing protein/CYTH domain-containing protein
MIELEASLLERSPEETARHLCLGLLREAEEALVRLERREDEEALHDFRVALRRLRSVSRAYRPHLKGSVKKKIRARLSDLADSTNAARDIEVQLAWLAKPSPSLEPEAREGASRLSERLRSLRDETPTPAALRRAFDPIHASLRKSLSRLTLRLEQKESFLSATGQLIAGSASRLEESLGSVSSADDGEQLHRARIEAKRLRYLLEPISARISEARALVKEMKSLQDELGELQDTRVLSQSIANEIERAAVEEAHRLRDLALREGPFPQQGASADPGLLALLRAQKERRDQQYLALSRGWLSGASQRFFERVQALALSLASRFQSPKPRRRFLLSQVPARAKRRAPALVRQGFLPGRRIHEHVESVQRDERARYSRVSASRDSRVEEGISKEAFERFWSLAPHRLERLHYRFRENGRTFWFDEVRDSGLVLAELEGEPDLALPEWLESVVTREVTGSRKYDWEALARREGPGSRDQRASSLGS